MSNLKELEIRTMLDKPNWFAPPEPEWKQRLYTVIIFVIALIAQLWS